MSAATPDQGYNLDLSSEQRARAEALRVAREVLADRGLGGSKGPVPEDLLAVAEFIISGTKPEPATPGGPALMDATPADLPAESPAPAPIAP